MPVYLACSCGPHLCQCWQAPLRAGKMRAGGLQGPPNVVISPRVELSQVIHPPVAHLCLGQCPFPDREPSTLTEARRSGQVSPQQGEISPGLFGGQLQMVPWCQPVWAISATSMNGTRGFPPTPHLRSHIWQSFKPSHTVIQCHHSQAVSC